MKQREFKNLISSHKIAFWSFVSIFFFSPFGCLNPILAQASKTEREAATVANVTMANSQPNASSSTSAAKTEVLASSLATEKLVHRGDVLEVDVLGSFDFDWRGKLDDEGFLSALPRLNVTIFALCRTEDQLAREIAVAYSEFIRKPEVIVRTLDRSARQPAVLLGAVRNLQRFQIERPVQLNELLILAGGITDRASGEINIFRPAETSCAAHNQNQRESAFIRVKLSDLLMGKTEANPVVRTGDIITVEEAAPVYVTGGVVAPQRLLFRQGLTVSRAIASAGGLSRNEDAAKIVIFRRQNDRADLQIIETDSKKIAKSSADDVSLQPHDILEILQDGRSQEARRPPIVNAVESSSVNMANLPLRVIN